MTSTTVYGFEEKNMVLGAHCSTYRKIKSPVAGIKAVANF